jgi:hypothetical protein
MVTPTQQETTEEARRLVRAAGDGDVSRVKALLAAGTNVNIAAEAGETALMRASAGGRLEVVKLLLDAGGDVHARSENGFTPLFMSVFFGHVEVARLLLARGSDPSAPTRVNTTAREWARTWGSAEIVELLEGFDATGAHAQTLEAARARVEQPDSPPVLFPTGGEARPVVPLSEIVDASGDEVTNPPPQAGEQEPDEATLVPLRARGDKSRPRFAPARREGMRVSWGVTVATVILSIAAGMITGAYLIEPGGPVVTRQTASQPARTTAPTAPASTGESVASANVNVSGAGGHAEEVLSVPGDDAVKDGEASAESVPENTPVPGERANDSGLRRHSRESATQRAAVVEAHAEPSTRATLSSAARREANDAVKQGAATKAHERAAQRPVPAQPKGSLPLSSLPAAAKSKQVIPWQ